MDIRSKRNNSIALAHLAKRVLAQLQTAQLPPPGRVIDFHAFFSLAFVIALALGLVNSRHLPRQYLVLLNPG